jgi:hypothetical protein
LYGKIISGFWEKSTVVAVVRYINEEPEACFTKTGVTRLYSGFCSTTFQKNCNEKLVCFGNILLEFYPGLTNEESSSDD